MMQVFQRVLRDISDSLPIRRRCARSNSVDVSWMWILDPYGRYRTGLRVGSVETGTSVRLRWTVVMSCLQRYPASIEPDMPIDPAVYSLRIAAMAASSVCDTCSRYVVSTAVDMLGDTVVSSSSE